MSGSGRRVNTFPATSTVLRAFDTANTGTKTMFFNNAAGPGVWVVVGAANGRSRWEFESPWPRQNVRLLAEDAQLEIKQSNEWDPSQSEASE
jgi:hypothetical protein